MQSLASVSSTILPVDDDTITQSARVEAQGSADTGKPAASCTNAAYVIFTSGSTGKPKVSTPYKNSHGAWC